MARSTGSHALPVKWGDLVRVKALLAFAGIHRSSAGISLASASISRSSAGISLASAGIHRSSAGISWLGVNISLPCNKMITSPPKMEGLFFIVHRLLSLLVCPSNKRVPLPRSHACS